MADPNDDLDYQEVMRQAAQNSTLVKDAARTNMQRRLAQEKADSEYQPPSASTVYAWQAQQDAVKDMQAGRPLQQHGDFAVPHAAWAEDWDPRGVAFGSSARQELADAKADDQARFDNEDRVAALKLALSKIRQRCNR